MSIHPRVEALAQGDVWKLLGVNVLKGNEGECELELNVKKEFTQSFGTVHGGIIATLLDMGMAAAISSTLDQDKYSNTIDLHINYLRPMLGETMSVKASIVKRGRRITVASAGAYNEEGKQIASATGNFMILDKN
ncbi:PaaI family thioesterase [Halalkalibacterium ligniniphilum]|uniref:PaaI family thioesterase n=1 Tax=Halalkalibacterium ligniniphilum TaxID=1134413 RepID=UPI00034715AA|nr:PaaI family thioesterase [Halalkalibacterium ligniniphilum]